MQSPYLAALERAFARTLAPEGFHEIARAHSTGFGDGFIDYEKGLFRLRLLSDRGQLDVHIGSRQRPDQWYSLMIMNKLVGQDVDYDGALADLVRLYIPLRDTIAARLADAERNVSGKE